MELQQNIEIEKKFFDKIWDAITAHKWYVFIILVLFVFVIKGCTSSTTTTDTTTTQTYTVISGNIENSLEVLGTTTITNLQTLVFGTEGKVTKIYVKEGDKVKAGDLLAELDKKQLNISLSQQSLSIQNARINYDKLINQYTAADILNAQNNVDGAQTKLDVAKSELVTLQAEQGDNVQVDSAKIQGIITDSKNIFNDAKNILATVDEIFYVTKANPRYASVQIYVSVDSTSYKDMTSNQYYTSKSKLTALEGALSAIQSQTSVPLTTVQSLENTSRDLLTSLYSMLDSAVNAVNGSMDGEVLPLATIQSRASSLGTSRSKVLTYQSTINTNISALANTKNDVASKKSEIQNYEAQLATYKQTLADMKAGPDNNDKTLQLNSLKQSQLSLAQTSQQKDNYEIRAPFDGTVDAIGFKVGDTVSYNAGSSANGITMSNPDIYEVKMLIDQIDIVKIDKGQEAKISFDAYPGFTVTGAITNIDPTPITSAGVVSYYASISLQKSEKKIYDGMSVTVTIILEKKDDVLVVPTVAIQTINGTTAVLVVTGGNTTPTSVTVGIADGVNSEILSGLLLNDVVSLTTYTASTTAASTTQSDLGSSMGSMRALEGGTSGGPGGGTPPN